MQSEILFADAKARVGAYGAADAGRALAAFVRHGSSNANPEGAAAVVDLVQSVRGELMGRNIGISDDEIRTMLFGQRLTAVITAWPLPLA